MQGISHRGVAAFGQALFLLNEPMRLANLPARFFEVISHIVPGHFFHISLTKPTVGAVDAFTSEPAYKELGALAEHQADVAKMPGIRDGSFYLTANDRPVSFFDLMEADELKSTVLWECFCTPLNLKHDLSVNFFSTSAIFFTISSSRDTKPYSDEERVLFALLKPHLNQRFRQLVLAEPDHPLAAHTGCPLDSHWVVVAGSGRVVRFGPGSRTMWKQLRLDSDAHIPVDWRAWMASLASADPAKTASTELLYHAGGRTFQVTCVRDVGSENCRLYLRKVNSTSGHLTPREREIADWIARGKSNLEIAEICGISRATVKVHVERILDKLEIGSRAGVAMAIQRG